MLQIALVVAIWYAVLDWKYVKAGGQRVTHSEWLAWIISVGTLSLLTIAALGINGGVLILMLAFMVYEARRWRVRRKHPLQGQQLPDYTS